MGNENYKVLVVDDEPDIVEMLKYNLKKEGYKVKGALNGKKAIELVQEFEPDVILLDIMMPKQDGIETCRKIREIHNLKDIYILFLTARGEEYSEVAAFESGADDYIVKPIKPRALLSRISAHLRRTGSAETTRSNKISISDLVIDKDSYTIAQKGEILSLPKKEFELLFFLAQNPNKVFNRDELLNSIWGTDVYVVARTVDVHIRKLREKLGEKYISTIKGVGYKFELS